MEGAGPAGIMNFAGFQGPIAGGTFVEREMRLEQPIKSVQALGLRHRPWLYPSPRTGQGPVGKVLDNRALIWLFIK
jgi:hypothetical protein